MTDRTDRELRRAVTALAEVSPPKPPFPGTVTVEQPARKRPQPLLVATASFAAVLALGLGAWLLFALISEDDPSDVTGSTPTTGVTSTVPEGTSTTAPVEGNPSQSPADALRDGVLPEVAALPIEVRVRVLAQAEGSEGLWVLSRASGEAPPELGCSSDGADCIYGVARISSAEYGEVLLMDTSGQRILRAYPMPGLVPSWIHVADEAVYVGRIGDGALPDSTLVQIDRTSLEATGWVFPHPTEGSALVADIAAGSWLDGWQVATEADSISALVAVGSNDVAGTAVTSWIGDVFIDLEGVRQFFAERRPLPAVGPVDVSGHSFIGMTDFGHVIGEDGSTLVESESYSFGSSHRMQWDGDRGIVYLDERGDLHHATPDGDRIVTGPVGDPNWALILDVAPGDPTLVALAVSPEDYVWVDLETGQPVSDGPGDRVTWTGGPGELTGGPLDLTAQGRHVRIDWPDWSDVPRGEGGELLGDFALPELVVEDATSGRELARFAIATPERPYLEIHDFDGRRVIVTRYPYEPANPPMSVMVIDLECFDCTANLETFGPVSMSLVGQWESTGPVEPGETG